MSQLYDITIVGAVLSASLLPLRHHKPRSNHQALFPSSVASLPSSTTKQIARCARLNLTWRKETIV